ncbi:hypothetical protein K474DRAFT_1669384 [Panus rudis PR-1116 ss-1]|nr:hypothetical protein K474DRAFT_1669384 [Panus rudis PR-1116 ss-1]
MRVLLRFTCRVDRGTSHTSTGPTVTVSCMTSNTGKTAATRNRHPLPTQPIYALN